MLEASQLARAAHLFDVKVEEPDEGSPVLASTQNESLRK